VILSMETPEMAGIDSLPKRKRRSPRLPPFW
jgi:hypothetical protein